MFECYWFGVPSAAAALYSAARRLVGFAGTIADVYAIESRQVWLA